MSEDTIFAKIIRGEVPATKLYEDEHCIVIEDTTPQAPVHLLVIPRKPLACLSDAQKEDRQLLGHLLWVARQMAEEQGTGDAFRIQINNGAGAGQTVFHLHLHLLGGTLFRKREK